ncbi:MAG: tautomerase family protein [Leptolyngbya sp. SIO4C1]|nr:tautomerase family protein [Leptolyngbya sp. SIO4C1]
MPQIKIYGLKQSLAPLRTQLSDAIHQSLVSSLQVLSEKRFQRFIWLEAEDFLFPRDRTQYYTILEISLFTGRPAPIKKQLIRSLYDNITAATPIAAQDLEITLFESPPANWGIRGVCGDEL